MLFAQGVVFAQACIGVAHSPAMAFAQAGHDGDCGKTANRNACLQQCTASDQNTSQIQITIPAMPTTPVRIVATTAPDPGGVLPDAVIVAVRAPDPPSSIRFCSFQL